MAKGSGIQVVVLCEDAQQGNFAYCYLRRKGLLRRQIRQQFIGRGQGCGEQYVRRQLPAELATLRTRAVSSALAVIIDEDGQGVATRQGQLREACQACELAPPAGGEPVAILIPARNIETWLRYLEDRPVDETTDYKSPASKTTRSCKAHVRRLEQLCADGCLPSDSPSQLRAACAQAARLLPRR